jgi:alkanesulfonate monooxygenase SsuD/methylene tetrahydromethanopterin reductase-like flavin-dependent oxidoreductase (luciferase family)
MPRNVRFGFLASPTDVKGADDETRYRMCIEDALFGASLGYESVWILEHHFSDYYPIPSPLQLLSHIAAKAPTLGLGTMVIVNPWHNPLRLAGEIAMLSRLSAGELHLGMGRGQSPMEFEAFGIDVDSTRERLHESVRVLKLALAGDPFSYSGKYLKMERVVSIRPRPVVERIHLYGAITNPDTASLMAELGIPPLSNGIHPLDVHRGVLKTWSDLVEAVGGDTDTVKPISIHTIIADTDAEADKLAREYLPGLFEAQVEHYRSDVDRYSHLNTYKSFQEIHERRVRLCNPDNLDGMIGLSAIGSPETVRDRIQQYIDIGFNKFIITTSTPYIPQHLRHEWLRRFAEQVAPHFTGGELHKGRT